MTASGDYSIANAITTLGAAPNGKVGCLTEAVMDLAEATREHDGGQPRKGLIKPIQTF